MAAPDTAEVGILTPEFLTSTDSPSRSTNSLLALRKSAPRSGNWTAARAWAPTAAGCWGGGCAPSRWARGGARQSWTLSGKAGVAAPSFVLFPLLLSQKNVQKRSRTTRAPVEPHQPPPASARLRRPRWQGSLLLFSPDEFPRQSPRPPPPVREVASTRPRARSRLIGQQGRWDWRPIEWIPCICLPKG